MGNHLASQSSQVDHTHLHDLPGILYESSLGQGWFLKTLRCIHDEGTCVVKVFVKRDQNLKLDEYEERLKVIKDNFALISAPNVVPFQKWENGDSTAYLIRQYFINNLYDRLSTRPFLTMIEKKWIAYQLLNGLSQAHFYEICHGDIKTENIMVTSWNWIYIADFASYKPVYLSEDNPGADFSYFFDTSKRRTCYIAPERFNSGINTGMQQKLTPSMDLFSAGCVIAELFLDGTPLFDFAQMLAYKKGEQNEPTTLINKINDPAIQELIKHMIQRDPEKRLKSAKDYLEAWKTKVFPDYFEALHKYVFTLMKSDSEDKVSLLQKDFFPLFLQFAESAANNATSSTSVPPSSYPHASLLDQLRSTVHGFDKRGSLNVEDDDDEELSEPKNTKGVHDQLGEDFIQETKKEDQVLASMLEIENLKNKLEIQYSTPSSGKSANSESSGNSKQKIPKKNAKDGHVPTPSPIINSNAYSLSAPVKNTKQLLMKSTSHISLPVAVSTNGNSTAMSTIPNGSEGLVILLNILCSFVHTVKLPSTKLTALELFSLFGKYLDSEIRLQRIVPHVVHMLSEDRSLVRATALRVLTGVLEQVYSFPPSDSHIFPAYLLPALQKFCSQDLEHDQLVREAFAENIARLADVARKFLEASQYFKQTVNEAANGSNSNGNPTNATTSANSGFVQESYESELSEIQDAFYDMVVEMLTKDTSTHVKVTLISDITRLCVFFGRQKTNDFLLPLIITFLNDRHHWELRCAFLNNIVGVSSFVGMDSLEHFILPCLLQALTDEEEFVIDKTVNSLASLCDLKLFRKHKLFDIAEKTAAMLYHPNVWIRYGVIAIMTAIASQLNLADIHCFLIPVLKPFLITDIIHINDANLLDALNPPVSRSSFDKAMLGLFNIISKVDNGIPLQSSSSSSSTVRDSMLISLTAPSADGKEAEALDPVDLAFLRYLSDQGIPKEEEEKLFAMKSFIKGACRGLSKKFKTNTEDESPSSNNSGNTKDNSGNSPYVVPSGGLILHSIALPNPNGGAPRNRQSAQPTPIGKGKAPIKLTSTSNFGSVSSSSFALGLSGSTPAPNSTNTSTITIKNQKTGDSPSSGSSGSGGKNEEWKHLFNGSNHSSPSLSNKNNSVSMGTSVSTPMNSRVHLDKNTFSPSSTSPANITLLNANTSSSLIPTSSASGSFVVTDTTSKMKAVHIISDYNPSSPSVAPAKSANAKSVNQNSSSTGTGAAITISSASLPLAKLFPPPMPDLGSLSFENSSGNSFNNSGSAMSPSDRNISSPTPSGMNNSGVSVSSPNVNTSTGNLGTESLKEWQPKGILVAHLHEHKGAISNIQVTSDNMFFVTGSDDGTVKIWDCRRLEKNVTNRSRLTYSSQGGKIKALTICESSHSVASGSDNGTIHVFKIEYATKKDTSLNRYTGVSTIKNLDPLDGAIMEIDHFNTDSQSIILYATNRGKVHAWDLRAKKEPFSLHNPPFFGLLETFVIEPNRNWIVTGTSSGYFTVWDLRFLIPVKFWRHPAKSRIHKLAHYHVVKNSSWFFCTSGVSNDVSVWDVQTASCKQYFRVLQSDASTPLPSFKVNASSDFGSGMPIATTSSSNLASAVTGGMGLSNFSSIDSTIEELQKQKPVVTNVNNSVQSSLIRNSSGSSSGSSSSDLSNIHLNSNGQAPVSVGIKAILNPADCSYLLTAGDDRRIRYWNLQNAMNSYSISGLSNDQPRPRYSSHVYDGITVYQELPNNSDAVNPLSNSMSSSSSNLQSNSSIIPSNSNSGGVSSISKLRGPSSAPINHHESVLDMKVMDYPHRMLLSAGRDGVVKVWR